jgi:pimeloyl-ACP methyl ester carboxylesterase
MQVELVEITTEDEVALPGAYLAPAADAATRERAVDAVVLNPGTGGSFHSRVLLGIGAALAEAGYGALTMSTRGHDIAWRHAAGRRYLGSAFESIADCALDFRGACDLLAARGHTRLALLGHSLGGTKALYHAAHDPDPRLAAVISCSGPRWSASFYEASERAEDFHRNRDRARALVVAGRPDELMEFDFPIGPSLMRAAGWLEKYDGETYSVASWCERITLPMLRVEGELETGVVQRGVADLLMERATASEPRRAVVIPGGDHPYSTVLDEVAAAVVGWLDELPLAAPATATAGASSAS